MPRFSREESAILIEVAQTFASTTKDEKVRSRLNSATRKLQQSADHHARRAAEQGRKT